MESKDLSKAFKRAKLILWEWNECSDALNFDSIDYSELEEIIKDCVRVGVQASEGTYKRLSSETDL